MIGKVTNIQRYSVNDGYGIRTIVFLAGCTMRCAWCQNPETMDTGDPVVMFGAESCSGCGACVSVCPSGAVRMDGTDIVYDRAKCLSCLRCVEECYFGARKASWTAMTVDEVFTEVMKDEAFFRRSGGGLTLSGGEPLLQADFSRELLARIKAAGLHTAVETAGHVSPESLRRVADLVDLFLYDIKAFNEETHKKATGVSNRRTMDNLRTIVGSGAEIIVRVPLIPGINDGAEFEAIADFVSAVPGLGELHILPYHTVGSGKYEQLGMEYPAADASEENDAEVTRCSEYARSKGLRVDVGGGGFARATG